MKSYRDLQDDKRNALLESFDEPELRAMQETAVRVMTHSNHVVALAMKRVGVNAATDVTGFGLIGHAGNVAAQSGVDVVIEEVPVIKGTLELADFFGQGLRKGLAAETAGGMLVFLPPEKVEEFHDVMNLHDLPCWTIGKIEKPRAMPEARLVEGVKFVETEFP
jgi:selenide,water dikinase